MIPWWMNERKNEWINGVRMELRWVVSRGKTDEGRCFSSLENAKAFRIISWTSLYRYNLNVQEIDGITMEERTNSYDRTSVFCVAVVDVLFRKKRVNASLWRRFVPVHPRDRPYLHYYIPCLSYDTIPTSPSPRGASSHSCVSHHHHVESQSTFFKTLKCIALRARPYSQT